MGQAKLVIETPFHNVYFSVSRIGAYEKCPFAFAQRYIEKPNEGYNDPAARDFGKLLHTALQLIYEWVEAEEYEGEMPESVILRFYRDAFEQSEVTGTERYNAGLKLVRNYFKVNRRVDHSEVLAIEQEFHIFITSDDGKTTFEVMGYIDRVDRIGAKTVRIIDYKTNRQLYTREDLDADLQLSIYGIAVKTLWPWVEHVEYGFDMLRHNTRQWANRSEEQLNRAADYVIAIGRRIESTLEFEPKLNPLCPWCDYRERCPAYEEAAQQGETTLSYLVATNDIEKVCAEHERAGALFAIAKRRKDEMNTLIEAHIGSIEEDTFIVNDIRYKMQQNSDPDINEKKVVDALQKALGLPPDFIRDKITVVQKGLVDKLISTAKLGRGGKQLVRAAVDAATTKNMKRPWVNARKANERKG